MTDLASRVRISAVFCALGGKPPIRGRARRFWRNGDGLNVSLSDQRGTWYDFVENIGGGVLDLIVYVQGGTREGALRWLAERFPAVPFEDRTWTPEQRADWGRRRRAALPLARLAWWWLQGRLAQLDDAKAAAVNGDHIDVGTLTFAASELRKLETCGPQIVLEEYERFRQEHPEECEGLIRAGRSWDTACQCAVSAVIAHIRATQERENSDAA